MILSENVGPTRAIRVGPFSVIEQRENSGGIHYIDTGRKVFVLAKTQTTKLCDGYRYIKELLIQLHNLAMQEAYDKLSRKGITVFSVKTDCFTIRPDDLEKAYSCLDTFYPDPITGGVPAIGQWRVSNTKNIIFPTSSLQKVENRCIELKPRDTQVLDIPDEYDITYICQLIEKHRRVMIRAIHSGCGKSYCA